jgi:hypothetical protein
VARGRRGLAISISIAIHAAIAAVFVLVRPPRIVEEPVVSIRILSKVPRPKRSRGERRSETAALSDRTT